MKANIRLDQDYSVYTSLKMVIIVDFFTNDKYHPEMPFSLPGWQGSRHHQSVSKATISSEFLYSQQNPCDVLSGELAMKHYLKRPVDEQYTYVKSSFWALQQMYEKKNQKVQESSLYLATKQLLIMGHKKLYPNETTDSLSKSQFAIILPMFLEKERRFVDDVLRPLFIDAGWVSKSDFRSKLLFFGRIEATLYAHQQRIVAFPDDGHLKMIREKRYMICLIEKSLCGDSLSLTLDIIQMRFDKDFIAASRSSISSSNTHLLAPQFLFPSKTIPIPNCVSTKILQLPRFILSRIFADSPGKVSFIHGDLYGFYLNNEYQTPRYLERLITDLLYFILDQNITDLHGIHRFVDYGIISESRLWQVLDQKERKNFTAVKCLDLLELFPLLDMSSIHDDIRLYAREHDLVLHSSDDIMVMEDGIDHKREGGMPAVCFERHIMDIKKSIFDLTKSAHPTKSFDLYFNNYADGIAFKTLTMIALSNRLKEPILLPTEPDYCSLELLNGVPNTREQTILEKQPGYSFYVEAKITNNHQIRLYLHQVMETKNGKEKSTLPIADTSIETGDMYDTICDVVWNASQEHSSLKCASSLSVYDHYNNFRSRLSALLEKMFNSDISTETNIHDLQSLYIGDTDCSCCIQISHKMILDMGVKLYLKGIAASIIACIKSPATFGKYKPKVIIITGSLLSEWTKLNNTLYRDFIWNQLEEELCLSIYQHQMKIHLIMSHTDLDHFPDEKLIKWEKYQQVVGDRRILVTVESFDLSGELYEDKGDRYELVPCMETDGQKHWRFHLINNENRVLGKSGFSTRYYIHPTEMLKERESSSEASLPKPPIRFHIDIYICSPQDQLNVLDPLTILKYETLVMSAYLYAGSVGLGLRYILKQGTDFPMVFSLETENYHLKNKLSLNYGRDGVKTALLSERITLEKILL